MVPRRPEPRSKLLAACLLAVALASCRGAAPEPPSPPTHTPEPPRLTLPPAWTETPTASAVPSTATPTATLHPAVLAARLTATFWPTLHVVAVGAGADASGWERFDFGQGSILLPPTFAQEDLRRLDDATEASLRSYAAGLASEMQGAATPAPGSPSPTPASLEDLAASSGFTFAAARDRSAAADVFIVSGKVPEGFDLETLMTEAFGSLMGEAEVGAQETIGGAPFPTERMVVTLYDRARGTVEPRVYYVTVVGDRMWTLIYRARDFEAMLPTFETSALSLSTP